METTTPVCKQKEIPTNKTKKILFHELSYIFIVKNSMKIQGDVDIYRSKDSRKSKLPVPVHLLYLREMPEDLIFETCKVHHKTQQSYVQLPTCQLTKPP
ncbi:hypothetical protein HNY73_021907 [Argiope bruennichi]|uniref:Uncharacterized protein n=1 Tax=Argiope bruennichi TaxID=94029 RepID=A0A8T0DZ44_ARGBR|nr:hypothetical protein HNY73_021907 [Argiope bruennichi]